MSQKQFSAKSEIDTVDFFILQCLSVEQHCRRVRIGVIVDWKLAYILRYRIQPMCYPPAILCNFWAVKQLSMGCNKQLSFACVCCLWRRISGGHSHTSFWKDQRETKKGLYLLTYLLAAMCVHILFFYCCHVRDTYWKIPFADDRAPSHSNSFGCTMAYIQVENNAYFDFDKIGSEINCFQLQ